MDGEAESDAILEAGTSSGLLEELNITCAESSKTATRVVGDGMLWSSDPQR
jgi:hypothetical protein